MEDIRVRWSCASTIHVSLLNLVNSLTCEQTFVSWMKTVPNSALLACSKHHLFWISAVGCPDIIPPKYSRMKRNGNKLDIDCPGTEQSWTLNCVDNAWQGRDKLGKCPPIPGLVEPEPHKSNSNSSIFSATLFNLPMGVYNTTLSGPCPYQMFSLFILFFQRRWSFTKLQHAPPFCAHPPPYYVRGRADGIATIMTIIIDTINTK